METKLSTKGQIVLPGPIRRRLGLQSGDSLEVKVQAGRVVLTPRKRRSSKGTLLVDPLTGLPVLSAGVGAPPLRSEQVREILAGFPPE
jgi:AbrB family looped-hinge helix DNA binding protein